MGADVSKDAKTAKDSQGLGSLRTTSVFRVVNFELFAKQVTQYRPFALLLPRISLRLGRDYICTFPTLVRKSFGLICTHFGGAGKS